jgi:predicted DNA-binding protein YlxM (UPF0122 family)
LIFFVLIFLFQTVETADEFQEIRELIDRYTTLKTNKEVLTVQFYYKSNFRENILVANGNSKSKRRTIRRITYKT